MLLKKYNTHAIKALGQNFLINKHILDKVIEASEISEEDFVIEIGPGLGFLTKRLAERSKHVLVVEIDAKMVEVLMHELPSNVRVIHGDAMKTNWKKELTELGWQGEKVKIAANLPYYITTPILFMFLEGELPVSQMVMMMQKEVAERIKAAPGGKEYGSLSVAVQYRCEVEKVCAVKSDSFFPQPEVESAVMKFSFFDEKPVQPKDEAMFSRVVRASFAQRRKTLRNTLGAVFAELKPQLPELLESVSVNPTRRGETLSVAEFAAVADKFYEVLN